MFVNFWYWLQSLKVNIDKALSKSQKNSTDDDGCSLNKKMDVRLQNCIHVNSLTITVEGLFLVLFLAMVFS